MAAWASAPQTTLQPLPNKEPQLLPVIATPLHDPEGMVLRRLDAILPDLKATFSTAYLGVTPATRAADPQRIEMLEADPFFKLANLPTHSGAGTQFKAIYADTSAACAPDTIVHLCFLDRVAYALLTGYREAFLADMQASRQGPLPLIYHRSPAAWETHPRNYCDLESLVTRTGEYLFGRTIDFAWCHMTLSAGELARIVPYLRQTDISMVCELALAVMDQAVTEEVDWLAWEDPFIYNRDPQELKSEREASPAETRKRLAYVIPMLRILDAESNRRG